MKLLELQVHVHSIKRASYTITNVSRIFNHPINNFYSGRIEKLNAASSCASLCSCTSKGSAVLIASFISVQWSKKQFRMQQKSMQAASALNFSLGIDKTAHISLFYYHVSLLYSSASFLHSSQGHFIPPHLLSFSQTNWMHCISCENI